MERKKFLTQLLNKNLSLEEFQKMAIVLFEFQYEQNEVYRNYVDSLGKNVQYSSIEDIPFLPISAFKNHKVVTGTYKPEKIFRSSGTSSSIQSLHFIRELKPYQDLSKVIFEAQYGSLEDHCILALLPSYLERNDSSLVHMVDHFIKESQDPDSGFYLNNVEELVEVLKMKQNNSAKTVLIGVSFALLDLAEKYELDFSNITIMETGGMKGRRKEIPREELHRRMQSSFGVDMVHSEYGMTELLSQAYSKGAGIFEFPHSMHIDIVEVTDPFTKVKDGKTGLIRIIDLGNIDSCAFILTEDLGRLKSKGRAVEVLGRSDQSDIRGCNLLIA